MTNVDDKYAAIDLPVFTCSSRDYLRLSGQVSGDGEAICFSELDDTGIPSLRAWTSTLGSNKRNKHSKTLRQILYQEVTGVQRLIEGIEEGDPVQRKALKDQWATTSEDAEKLEKCQDLEKVDDGVKGLTFELAKVCKPSTGSTVPTDLMTMTGLHCSCGYKHSTAQPQSLSYCGQEQSCWCETGQLCWL